MANLGPQHINQSFGDLLQLPNGLTPAIQNVQDGSGNVTPLEISTTVVDFPISSPSGTSGMISDFATDAGSNYIGFLQAGTGAVTDRSAQDKMREWVSVADFGAVGDGFTNDAAAIQAAIDSGAAEIRFPTGTYGIGQPLIVRTTSAQNLTFVGESRVGTIIAPLYTDIKQAPDNINAIIINKNNDGKFSLNNMRFWSAVGFTGNVLYALENGTTSQAIFSGSIVNCWFDLPTTNTGIFYGALNNYKVVNNTFENAKTCFVLIGAGNADIFFDNNSLYNCYDAFVDAGRDANSKNLITITNINQYGTFRGSLIDVQNGNQWIISNVNVQADNASATSIGLFNFVDSSYIIASNFSIRSVSGGTIGTAITISGVTESTFSNGFVNGADKGVVMYGTSTCNVVFDNVTITDVVSFCFEHTTGLTPGRVVFNNCTLKNSLNKIFQDTSSAGAYDLIINGGSFVNAGYPSGSASTRIFAVTTSGNTYITNAEIGRDSANAAAAIWLDANGTGDFVLTDCRFTPLSPSSAYSTGTQLIRYAGGVGYRFRQYYDSAAPTSGTWQVGDRVFNSTPAVGSPKGWICTVTGTPGTWVSEGNL